MIEDLRAQLAEGLLDTSLTTTSRWATHKLIMPHPFPGPPNWARFPWLVEPLNARDAQITVKKAAQMGYSVVAMIKGLHTVSELKLDALIVQPAAHLAADFSKARLDGLVANSPKLHGLFKKTDAAGLKVTKYHTSLYIRGSIAESSLVSMPVSTAIIDEFDKCNINSLALIEERMSAHEDYHIFVLSTPTLPEEGIDEEFIKGTQELFMFTCPGCKRTIHLEWPDCVEIIGEGPHDPRCHESFYKCTRCDRKLPHDLEAKGMDKADWLSTAMWQSQHQAYNHRSFLIPQMYGPAMTAGRLVVAFMQGEADEIKKVQFVNQKLAETYIMDGSKLDDETINACISDHLMTDPSPAKELAKGDFEQRMIVMGVDVGSFLDVVISEYLYLDDPQFEPHLNSIAKVLWAARIPLSGGYNQLDNLMQQFSIQHVVFDAQPETNSTIEFAKQFQRGLVSMSFYREGVVGTDIKVRMTDEKVPILTVNRTAWLDQSLGRFYKKRVLLPADTPYVFKEHLKTPKRTYVFDSDDRPVAKYSKKGADHLAHAFAYCEIAHVRAYVHSTGRAIGNDESIRNF